MAKNVDPRYTNILRWTGGTIDTSTVTFEISAQTTDHRINWILISNNSSTGIQTMTMEFMSSASASLSSFEINVPANSGVSGTTTLDALSLLPLPSDSAGNKVLHVPAYCAIKFTCSAAESNTLDIMAEIGDFAAD